MKFKITVNIKPEKICRRRGLSPDTAANTFFANEVKRLADPYVPMQQGALKNGSVTPGKPALLTYETPYAHYQWTGQVMGGRAPKHYTGAAITYHGAPMRGKLWIPRMMADRGREVVKSLADYVGGKPG